MSAAHLLQKVDQLRIVGGRGLVQLADAADVDQLLLVPLQVLCTGTRCGPCGAWRLWSWQAPQLLAMREKHSQRPK